MFTPVLAEHSKSFSLIDCISVGVDCMQRNFEPMRKQVEASLARSWVDYEWWSKRRFAVVVQEGVGYLGNPSTSQTLQAETTSPNAR